MSHPEARCRYAGDEYKPVTVKLEWLGTQMVKLEWEDER